MVRKQKASYPLLLASSLHSRACHRGCVKRHATSDAMNDSRGGCFMKWRRSSLSQELASSYSSPGSMASNYPRSRRSKDGVKMDDTDIASDQEREPEVWDPCHLSSTEHDSLDLFFASVCQSTKRLPKKFQSSVKRQVLDALLRVEDEWETEQTESKTEVNKDFH